ncbi:MAG: hypothetical protein Kow0037_12390 [Calditrichia bacterium]
MKNHAKSIHLKTRDGEPIVRIGLVEGQDYIDFRTSGEFDILDAENEPIIENVKSKLKWRVKIKESKPGQEQYYLKLYETHNREEIEEKLKTAQKYSLETTIEELGGDIFLGDKKINNNTKYILKAGNFKSALEAKRAAKQYANDFNPTVDKETAKSPKGVLEFFDAEYIHSGESKHAFKIIPKDVNTKTKLYSLRTYDELLQKDHYEDRIYNGGIEFRIDNQGKLMIISELPLETYLKRVVYSETGEDLPIEFIKSMAIVARSEVLARIEHKHLGDPYDMCDWGHCLRYYGDDFDDPNIDKAIEQTRGQVIFTPEGICDAYFNLLCGGHTEDASGVWDVETSQYSHAKFDWKEKPEGYEDLKSEEAARRWILNRPQAFCNLAGRQVSPTLDEVKKYFRWEVNYTRSELEEIVKRKTGQDIGIIFDIIPIERGKSGRLKEIELIGSLNILRIRGELKIRESLSYNYLESSCFIIEKEFDDIGTPISFSFIGAGQGHGIGMCKTGAAVMATEGYKWDEILKHYFKECTVKSIYEM